MSIVGAPRPTEITNMGIKLLVPYSVGLAKAREAPRQLTYPYFLRWIEPIKDLHSEPGHGDVLSTRTRPDGKHVAA